MAGLKEKLVCIKFCFKPKKSAIDTFNTLKEAFETKKTQVCWVIFQVQKQCDLWKDDEY